MRHLLTALSLFAFLTTAASAQIKSIKLLKDEIDGYQWKVPRNWGQIPPQPGELNILAKFNHATAIGASQLFLLRFEPKSGTTPATPKINPDQPGSEGPPKEKVSREEATRRFRESMQPRSFSQWYSRVRRGKKIPSKPITELKLLGGMTSKVYFMPEHGGTRPTSGAGMASVFQHDGREWAMFFVMPRRDFVNLNKPTSKTKIWSKVFTIFQSFKPIKKKVAKSTSGQGDSKADRLAAVVEKAGHRLPKDWFVVASPKEHYVIVHHIPRKKTRQLVFVTKIKNYIEFMRKRYEELFPPVKPITAISVVRVCRDREEYHQYGGPRGSAGYWNPRDKELVIYDASTSGGAKNSYSTLFHEAFHQYIYYAVGEISPHSWFNEGYGDYFAGANPKNRFKIGPFQWRTKKVLDAVSSGKAHHLNDLMHFSKMQYYTRDPGMCYAQGWALIYFLNSKKGRSHSDWKHILPNYFNTLVKTRSQKKALKAAIGGLDMEALNDDYIRFIKRGFK